MTMGDLMWLYKAEQEGKTIIRHYVEKRNNEIYIDCEEKIKFSEIQLSDLVKDDEFENIWIDFYVVS